ncbi:hypothetical protein FRX31_018809, partial [Thalictrum thalictroides]
MLERRSNVMDLIDRPRFVGIVMENESKNKILGDTENDLENRGQLEEKDKRGPLVEKEKRTPLFQFTGAGEETPRKRVRRENGEEYEGTERFSYGVGSIVDTVELRDYTCTLGRRAREHSDELIRLILAMRTDKASMTKAREEAFRK